MPSAAHPKRTSWSSRAFAPSIGVSLASNVEAIADRMRAIDIDNFAFAGDMVRIGSTQWRLSACACGFSDCDGWALEPVHHETNFNRRDEKG